MRSLSQLTNAPLNTVTIASKLSRKVIAAGLSMNFFIESRNGAPVMKPAQIVMANTSWA